VKSTLDFDAITPSNSIANRSSPLRGSRCVRKAKKAPWSGRGICPRTMAPKRKRLTLSARDGGILHTSVFTDHPKGHPANGEVDRPRGIAGKGSSESITGSRRAKLGTLPPSDCTEVF